MERSRLAQSRVAWMLASLSSGKADDEGKMPGNAVLDHLLRGLVHLLDLDVLADALQHLVGAGLDADQQPAQARLLAARPHLIRQPHALIGAHGRRPGDLHARLDDLLGERLRRGRAW